MLWRWIKSRLTPRGPTVAPVGDHMKMGEWGEQVAAEFLQARGYEILERRYRVSSLKGEIDLIALDPSDRNCLVFVEVKTRRSKNIRVAEAAVHWAKQRAMIRMGRSYLRIIARCLAQWTAASATRMF